MIDRASEYRQSKQVPVKRDATNRAVSGPSYPVPPGAVVEISPLSNNTVDAFFSEVGPDQAEAGTLRTKITATGLPRRITPRNLADVWVYSANAGEGLLLTVLFP